MTILFRKTLIQSFLIAIRSIVSISNHFKLTLKKYQKVEKILAIVKAVPRLQIRVLKGLQGKLFSTQLLRQRALFRIL